MTDTTNIIVKIKKLLALSTSSNENEAQAAMTKAQEMLAKYKLTIKDIDDIHSTPKNVNSKATAVTFKKATWKGLLASVIADNFCCYSYFNTFRTHRIVFMGLTEDVETATAVFEYATEYIVGKTQQLKKKYYRLGESAKGLENDYAQGFIKGLSQKYEAQKQKNQEWAIVLIKSQIVVQEYENMKFRKKPVNCGAKFSGFTSAYEQGRMDGKKFEMISGHIEN